MYSIDLNIEQIEKFWKWKWLTLKKNWKFQEKKVQMVISERNFWIFAIVLELDYNMTWFLYMVKST